MAEAPALRVLIVDDEPLGRERVAALLRRERGVEIVGMIGDGRSAVAAIASLAPDLVFLDVQMPGMTGLEVVRAVGAKMPTTVFVTAFDRHAVEAFDLAAIDYLVKPFDDERFEAAFQRARRLARLEEASRLRERLLAVLQESGDAAPDAKAPAGAGAESRYLERIAVESRGKVRFIPVSDIDYILASGPYAELVVGDRKHLIREAMQALEDRLDPARFVRVHRSAIVQLDRVDALMKGGGGECELQLRNGVKIRVARSRREDVEKRLAR